MIALWLVVMLIGTALIVWSGLRHLEIIEDREHNKVMKTNTRLIPYTQPWSLATIFGIGALVVFTGMQGVYSTGRAERLHMQHSCNHTTVTITYDVDDNVIDRRVVKDVCP